jgi:hypothetical protein
MPLHRVNLASVWLAVTITYRLTYECSFTEDRLQTANTIFRLANKFSMRYYQSAVGFGAYRAPLQQSICFMFGRFDSANFTVTRQWLSVHRGASSFASLYVLFAVGRQKQGIRFKNQLSPQTMIAVVNSINCYQYKSEICNWSGLRRQLINPNENGDFI